MVIGRGGQVQEALKQGVEIGRRLQILPAHHVGDPLNGVVPDHREVVARRYVAPGDHRIAPAGGIGRDRLLRPVIG